MCSSDLHLTDGQGRLVDFKNTIIIMTTNIGTKDITRTQSMGFSAGDSPESDYRNMKAEVTSDLKKQFRPEFLNRLDDIIVFQQLTKAQVRQIVDMQVDELSARLFARHMSIGLTDAAKDLLTQKGFDPLLGARPLRRVIQNEIEDSIAERILQGTLRDGEMITVDAQGEGPLGEFLFESRPFDAATETGAGAPATAEPAALEPTAAGDAGDAGLTKAE